MTLGKNKVIHDIVIAYLKNVQSADPKQYANKYIDAYKQIEQVLEARGNESGELHDWMKNSDFFTS